MSRAKASAADSRNPAPQTVNDVIDQMRADFIIEFAARAESLWRSVADAAFRGELLTMRVHCRQISSISREVFRTVRELSAGAGEGGAQ
jgi:hypothetical protein